MKPKSKMLVAVVLGLTFSSIGCAGPKGACTESAAVGPRCLPDATVGLCRTILGDNARFHEGVTCSDLGFRVTDGSENPTMNGITGV